MLLIYTPEDGERQEFVFRPDQLLSIEAELLEECGGTSWETYDEYGEKFIKGNLKALRAALWVMLRRTNPRLKFVEVVVRVNELGVDLEDDERERMRARIEADGLDDETRAQALALLDEGRPTDGMATADEPVGKDDFAGLSTGSP